MNESMLTRTVGQLVAERPARARVFERHGIDYCCGGKKPLARACADKGLDPDTLLRELGAVDATGDPGTKDWSAATLAELIEHIVGTHHQYLRRELPRLAALAVRVATRHGPQHPEYVALRDVFLRLRDELEVHLRREEEIVFPACRLLQEPDAWAQAQAEGLGHALVLLEQEHQESGEALGQIRTLTRGFVPPADACHAQRALIAGLAELEADLHRHIHKENSALFPRAVALAGRSHHSRHAICKSPTTLH